MSRSKRISPRNKNQLKITNMFTTKRNRSPTDDNFTNPVSKLNFDIYTFILKYSGNKLPVPIVSSVQKNIKE